MRSRRTIRTIQVNLSHRTLRLIPWRDRVEAAKLSMWLVGRLRTDSCQRLSQGDAVSDLATALVSFAVIQCLCWEPVNVSEWHYNNGVSEKQVLISRIRSDLGLVRGELFGAGALMKHWKR